MKFFYGALLIFSCGFDLTFSSYEGRLPLDVPVYYPPYNPVDMEQFRPRIKAETVRRISLTFQEALKMVRRQKLQPCVSLMICTLTCNRSTFGKDGDDTYTKLIHFNHLTNSTRLSESLSKDITLFKDAERQGLASVGNCDKCKSLYQCRREVPDLLKIFLNFDIAD